MCRLPDMLRQAIGISGYTPGTYPHARVRKPTRHGARGNGHAVMPGAPPAVDNPVVAYLAQQHRLIRQILADAARARCRRQDA